MGGSNNQFNSRGLFQPLLEGCIAILMSVIALRLAWTYVQPILPVIVVGICVIAVTVIIMAVIRVVLLRRNRW